MPTLAHGVTSAYVSKPWLVDANGALIASGGSAGTAGTPAAGVTTVQGVAGETPVMVQERSQAATTTSFQVVVAAATSTVLALADPNRTSFSIYNSTTAIAYVRKGAAAASATSFDFVIQPGAMHTSDSFEWTGELRIFSTPGGTFNFQHVVPRGRVNLFAQPEAFDNGEWGLPSAGVTVTPNTTIAPDGTTTADSLVFDATTSYRYARAQIAEASLAGKTYTFSVHIWSPSKATIGMRMYDPGGSEIAVLPVSLTPGVTRVSLSKSFTVAGTYIVAGLDNRLTLGGDGIAGTVVAWGAQMELGPVMTRYQWVRSATDYDTAA
jgi:uncharacterized RDD family membrane protein YckC